MCVYMCSSVQHEVALECGVELELGVYDRYVKRIARQHLVCSRSIRTHIHIMCTFNTHTHTHTHETHTHTHKTHTQNTHNTHTNQKERNKKRKKPKLPNTPKSIPNQ